ncbi:MAG TPA: Ig-like domain-containing protein [Longimicrobium sp.]|nr:Ig-like domain-containing protein [Longimicrobium sp.]
MSRIRTLLSPRRWALVALAAVAAACSGDSTGSQPGVDAQLQVSANVSATPISTLVVEVTAPDITNSLVFNLQVQNGTASGTLKMPSGNSRTITVKAFDSSGQVTHEGSVTLNVSNGSNPPVSVTLGARSGHVPVTVSVGDHSVAISPASATLAAGDSLQLTATITGAGGGTISGQVEWATLNPGIATVSATGLVRATNAGQVQIVATYAGVGGSSTITIP